MSRPANLVLALAVASLCGTGSLFAQSTLTPLATFGTNGWLQPGSSTYLGTGNLERGLAYNPATGNLILCSRAVAPGLRILNGATGADLGGLDTTGVAGGTFTLNLVDCGADGTIYACNLSTSAAANFKVYKWVAEVVAVPPSVAFDSLLTNTNRVGDSFAVTGGTPSTPVRWAAAGSNSSTALPGSNSQFHVGSTDASNTASSFTGIPGTIATSNGYRLGLTWVDQDTVVGSQGATAYMTDFNTATSTANVVAAITTSAAQRAMDYAVINGTPVLAILDSNSSILSVYDVSFPTSPTLLASGTATSGALSANGNGTGAVQWGAITGSTATVYAMNSNQGIQAFTFSLALPATARSIGAGCGTPALALASSGAPILPSTVNLDLTNMPTTALAFYVLGFSEIPGGLPLPVAPTCNQYVVPTSTNLVVPTTPGSATYTLNVPNSPSLAGLVFFGQGLSFDTASGVIQSSNALRFFLQTF